MNFMNKLSKTYYGMKIVSVKHSEIQKYPTNNHLKNPIIKPTRLLIYS